MIKPFTESDIEDALELFNKMSDECTEDERKRRDDLLARLRLQSNAQMYLDRLKQMATPRDIP